jgi:putative transposase
VDNELLLANSPQKGGKIDFHFPIFFFGVAVVCLTVFLNGLRAVSSARRVQEKERNFTGEHFWARGYAVSTVGCELESVKKYIREQETADKEGRF